MKKIFIVTLCCFSLYACTKEVGSISYSQSLLSNKTWFLDYTIQENNKSLSIHIEGTTQNGSPAKYNYLIEQIGSDQLIVSFQIDGIKTKKIFSTTH